MFTYLHYEFTIYKAKLQLKKLVSVHILKEAFNIQATDTFTKTFY